MGVPKRQHRPITWTTVGIVLLLALAGAGLLACQGTPPAPTLVAPATGAEPPLGTEVAAPAPTASVPPAGESTPLPQGTPDVATSTPSPAASAQPTFTGTVSKRSAGYREGPGLNYPVIGQPRVGDQLILLGRSPAYSWLYVQLPDGQMGWIEAASVTRPEHLSLPVIDVTGGGTPYASTPECEC